jgi:hypothetical protein
MQRMYYLLYYRKLQTETQNRFPCALAIPIQQARHHSWLPTRLAQIFTALLGSLSHLVLITLIAASAFWLTPRLALAAEGAGPTDKTEQGYTIRGSVLDFDNTPVSGAMVSTGWGDPQSAYANTDSQGNYTITVDIPGIYNIHVSRFYNSLDPAPRAVSVPPSQTAVNFTFAPYDTIRGTVVDPAGQPIAWATVTSQLLDTLYISTLTDENGAYTLAVTPGIYHLTAIATGLVSPPVQRVVVPPSHIEVNFALLTPYTIQGTVRTFDGQPLSGANLVTSEDDPMIAYASTDSEGNYTMVVREGTYHIWVSAYGLGSPPFQVATVPANQSGVDFTMPQPFLISGTVRDDLGNPVAGASVGVGIASVTHTAADGTYTLAIGSGEQWVTAYSDDTERYDDGLNSVLVRVPPAAQKVDFVFRLRNRTLSGRVVDPQGQPIAMATVLASNPLTSNGQAQETDANGIYTLTVPAGVYWIKVTKYFSVFDHSPTGRIVFEPSLSQEIDVSTAPVTDVNFTLEPAGGYKTIHGHVLDAQGGPVQAMVSASPTAPMSCEPATTVQADESGAYTLTVKPGPYLVTMYHDRWPALPAQNVVVESDAIADFTFPPLYVLSGWAQDTRGKPVRSALMQANTSAFNGLYNSSLTDDDGWYTLIVAEGTYTITAYDQAFAAPAAGTFTTWAAGGEVNFVLTPLPAPDQVIQGIVLDENGQPAPNGVVAVAGELFGGKTTYYDGTFSRVLYPGTYSLAAGGSSYTSSPWQEVALPPSRSDVTFHVRRADQFIFGQVVDEAGNPLCHTNVQAVGENASAIALTDGSGRFAMRVPAGVYTIQTAAGSTASASQTVTVPPTATQINLVVAEGTAVQTDVVYLPAVIANH